MPQREVTTGREDAELLCGLAVGRASVLSDVPRKQSQRCALGGKGRENGRDRSSRVSSVEPLHLCEPPFDLVLEGQRSRGCGSLCGKAVPVRVPTK